MSSLHLRRLPLAQALRLQGPSAIWFKPALSVVVSAAPPNLLLLALGRLDLALYTMAGSLCALYAHHRPYPARARVLTGVVLGMTAGLGIALLASALTPGPVVLVIVGALLAAAQKTVCEATRVGPPGNVVVTFISSAALFVPQTPSQVPGHLALALAAGAWAWLVCMAPGALRPHGPERRAVAAALRAAATAQDDGHVRARTAAHNAWQTLRTPGTRPDPTRRALEHLLIHAEAAPADADQLRAWARALRGTGRVPEVPVPEGADAHADRRPGPDVTQRTGPQSLPGTARAPKRTAPERPDPRADPCPRPATKHRGPLHHLTPIATRTALGCALAGLAALALGVGRPYWALVTAASLFQANVTLTWSRGVQRVVGNVLGVLLFAALTPLTRLHPAALVVSVLACSFGAEALIARNYWLGTVCVTPMALLITEFTHLQDPGVLITQRVLDTLVGALAGLAAAVVVTNRRAGDRVTDAITAAEHARARTEHLLGHPDPAPHALPAARRALAAALTDLRATADTAQGEWWQRPFPAERLVLAEQAGHRTLAAAVRHRGAAPLKQD
ncbi:FUSC family protein [Streptomyces seoulensis]|uniref:FUSC family protein n=1 Tax=Streptomyces seoulensis TaxID=73044 RepID=UPI001FCA935B|nr:FUSC family protein [Streptomyces seoulensis]BDH05357.1 FUSC family protein [Streptomyces seoulensis]